MITMTCFALYKKQVVFNYLDIAICSSKLSLIAISLVGSKVTFLGFNVSLIWDFLVRFIEDCLASFIFASSAILFTKFLYSICSDFGKCITV